MKYFTSAWWAGDDKSDAGKKYRHHFESIKNKLSETIIQFDSTVNLHDAQIAEINFLAKGKILFLSCKYYDANDDVKTIGMQYGGVAGFYIIPSEKDDLSEGFDDLGYDEFDLHGDLFEHRMLFASGREMRVVFKEFSFAS